MVQVNLPRSLAILIPDLPKRADVAGSTVAELIAALDTQWPGVADRVLEAGPAVREHINVFVDGEPATLESTVAPDSVVHVIPAVAGG